jgi:two-component system nitrogen regulation response regulator GlnG
VIDDDRSIQHLISRAFQDRPVRLIPAASSEEGFRKLNEDLIDVVILDVLLPDSTGLELFGRIRELDSKLPVIFITVGSDSETAIEAMKLGAFDYLTKPLDLGRLQALVAQGLEIRRLMNVRVSLDSEASGSSQAEVMLGKSPQMLEVYKSIGRVASQDIPVLILGESGTGKELVARAIYQHSHRATGPFMALNCAAIPEALLESELFGHEKGAFTGATGLRIGKFEQCKGGTFLLDEIGDMPLVLQPKILRLLQEQSFERVGSNHTIQSDVRIVASTHRDLESRVAANEFRADLFFRLNGVSILLPPLRERREDIPLLVEHFLNRYRHELKQDVRAVSPEAMEFLAGYHWPGNVRELQSCLKLAMVRATGTVLIPEFLPPELLTRGRSSVAPGNVELTHIEQHDNFSRFIEDRLLSGSEKLYEEAVERLDRQLLLAVLTHTEGNQSQAARILGITRGNLRNKIRTLGLAIEQRVRTDDESSALSDG